MTITLNIPDELAPDLIDKICVATNYSAKSGLTKGAWARQSIISFVKQTYKRGCAQSAGISAAQAADQFLSARQIT